MKTRNSCYTYFKIVGDFCPDRISEQLGVCPETSWKIGDTRKDGDKYGFALWTTGRCDAYDVAVENQMRKTVAPLLDKIDILNRIRAENAVSFFLEIVQTIYCDDVNPCLAPSLDIIDFCHATRTEIDMDLRIVKDTDE